LVYAFADDTRRIEDINDEFWTDEEYVNMLVDQLKDAKNGYFRDGYLTRWHNQPRYIEVMIEKDSLQCPFETGGRRTKHLIILSVIYSKMRKNNPE